MLSFLAKAVVRVCVGVSGAGLGEGGVVGCGEEGVGGRKVYLLGLGRAGEVVAGHVCQGGEVGIVQERGQVGGS